MFNNRRGTLNLELLAAYIVGLIKQHRYIAQRFMNGRLQDLDEFLYNHAFDLFACLRL